MNRKNGLSNLYPNKLNSVNEGVVDMSNVSPQPISTISGQS